MSPAEMVAAFLAPLDGDDPVGQDPRSTEEFEAIGNELAKIGGVELLPVDWEVVARHSAHLLQTHGKDLRLAVYWVVAQACLEGLGSLQVGVSLLERLLEDFGETIHPRRPRARASIFSWFAERLEIELSSGSLTFTGDEKAALVSTLDRTAASMRRLELDFSPIRRLEALVQEHGSLKLSEEEQRAEVLGRFDAEFAELGATILAHESLLERTPRGLRLHRFALWDSIPELADGVLDTALDQSGAEELASLFAEQKWSELLERAETAFSVNPFWLDLTFYSARAALHVFDRTAVLGVVGQLRDLLARQPALVEAADAAGQPLLSENAREWVHEAVFESEGSQTDTGEVLPTELRSLLDEGRLKEALAEATGWIAHPEGRVRFSRSVILAEAFGAVNSAKNAHVVFRGLHNHLRQMTVKEWDPPIFSACIRGFLSTKRDAMELGPEDEHLMDELSALDPAALLSILPSS